mgnify:CR=1 FL=1
MPNPLRLLSWVTVVAFVACSDDAAQNERGRGDGVSDVQEVEQEEDVAAEPDAAGDLAAEDPAEDQVDAIQPPEACPCDGDDCSASDDDFCDALSGLCDGGRCYAMGTLEPLPHHADGYWVSGLARAADATWVASAAEVALEPTGIAEVRLWSVQDPTNVVAFAGARWVAAHPLDAQVFALAYAGRVDVRRRDAEEPLWTFEGVSGPVAFSLDGAWLLAADGGGALRFPALGFQSLEDASAFVPVRYDHPEDRDARMWVLAFSPGGDRVAVGRGVSGLGSPVGDLRFFDAASGARLATLECPASSGSFSSDGRLFAASCWNYVGIYDVDAGRLEEALPAPNLALGVAYLEPDAAGERLFVGSFVNVARVLQRQPGSAWRSLAAVDAPGMRSVVELPDGSLVLGPWADQPPVRWTPVWRAR